MSATAFYTILGTAYLVCFAILAYIHLKCKAAEKAKMKSCHIEHAGEEGLKWQKEAEWAGFKDVSDYVLSEEFDKRRYWEHADKSITTYKHGIYRSKSS